MSKLRSRIVNRELFNQLGVNMQLDKWMSHVAPYAADLKDAPDLLGNTFEALIGAIFLDKGFEYTRRYFEKTLIVNHLEFELHEIEDTNFKSRLLEWGQKTGKKVKFTLDGIENEEGKALFQISVVIDDTVMGKGVAKRKKKAEQEAARKAVEKLGLDAH